MIKRWGSLAICMVLGDLLGLWVRSLGAFNFGFGWGLSLGVLVWLVADSLHAVRLLSWLRAEQNSDSPIASSAGRTLQLTGIWGELLDRIRRLLKNRDQHYQEIQDRLDEFLAAMQASPNGVVLLDGQGRIEWCNQMATEHFGFDIQRDVSQYIVNLVRDPAFSSYMAAGNFLQDVLVPGRASSTARPVKLSVHVHAYGQNRKLLLSRDITSLELAEVMRRDFVANVSHEIRTPLTVLAGFIETLQTLPLPEADRSRYLVLMAQQSVRMQTLVNDLLTLSRLEGGPAPGVNEWTPVNALLAQCEQEAKALSNLLAPRLGHRIEFSSSENCDVSGVHTELLSAVSNLVTNAVRYTPEGGSVHVRWHLLADGRGEFSVTDTGPGIAPEHLPRLTERFYRVDRSRSRETGGTGLGLAIVKHVAQRHSAALHIESQLEKGSSFSLVFPAVRVRQISVQPSPAQPCLQPKIS